jgi:hypothetical protein
VRVVRIRGERTDVERARSGEAEIAHRGLQLRPDVGDREPQLVAFDGKRPHRVSTSVPSPVVSPAQPSGTQQVDPESSSTDGPSTL